MNNTNIVSLSKKSIGNLIVIDLKKDCSFASVIFDTGASISVLNKTTAEKFGAKQTERKIRGGGTAGKETEADLSTFKDIKLGEYTVPELDFIVVEDEVLHFGEDEVGNELVIDGFLGWDIISKLRWEYKHEKLELHFGESVKTNYENCKLDEWDNMPIVNVMLDGQERVFGFDSGHTESIIGSLLYSDYKHLDSTNDDVIGIDGHSNESVKIADSLEIEIINSTISLKDISVINRNLFPSKRNDIGGLLGFDLLEGRNWIFDYENRYFEIFDIG